MYYYILNQQGDVIRIVDGNGRTAAEYVYNGWGEILSAKQATGTTIGELNPIRYRGYYYDSELNMYYLQSRYYDPVVKRMLSADDENITDDATLEDNNLFAYCDNEPIGRSDDEGDFWQLALAGGGIASGSGAVLASVTPVGLVVVGVAVVATVGYHAYRTRTQNHISYSKAKSRYNQEEKQKKQAKKIKNQKKNLKRKQNVFVLLSQEG